MTVTSSAAAGNQTAVPRIGAEARGGTFLGVGRDNNFDVMRWGMAVLVIWSHCFALLAGNDDTEPLHRLTGGHVTFGGIAVDVFFIISGFLIAMSWERSKSVWMYLRNRVCRIYPGFLAVTLICAFVITPLITTSWGIIGGPFWAAAKLDVYFSWPIFGHNPIPGIMNGSLWTVQYEFKCYLLILALGLLGLFRRRVVVAVLLGLAMVAYAMPTPPPIHPWILNVVGGDTNWFRFLCFYLAGTAFYLYRDAIPNRAAVAGVCAALMAGSLFYLPALPVALAVCGTYLVFWLAFTRIISFPRWTRYGDFSYGIYLWAFPIQQLIVMKVGASNLSPGTFFALATPCAMVAGVLSWHLVEKWFMRKKAKPGADVLPR